MLARARASVTDDSISTVKSLNSTSWLLGSGVPREIPHAVGDALSVGARAGCGAAGGGACDVHGRVRLHVGDRDLERREAALLLHDPRRELDAAESRGSRQTSSR